MIFYLSKILPNLVLPIGITFILILLAGLTRKWIFLWVAVAVFYLCSNPLTGHLALRAIEKGMVRRTADEMTRAEGIVVLSGGRSIAPGESNVSEWTDADRFFGGVELYKAEKAPLLIFTGGWAPQYPDAITEGEILVRYAKEFGVSAEAVLTTGKVLNTAEEAVAVAAILAPKGDEMRNARILLVTSAFHMPRARAEFESVGFEVDPFPVDFLSSVGRKLTLMDLIPTAQGLSETSLALRELYGRVFVALFR